MPCAPCIRIVQHILIKMLVRNETSLSQFQSSFRDFHHFSRLQRKNNNLSYRHRHVLYTNGTRHANTKTTFKRSSIDSNPVTISWFSKLRRKRYGCQSLQVSFTCVVYELSNTRLWPNKPVISLLFRLKLLFRSHSPNAEYNLMPRAQSLYRATDDECCF